MSPKRTDNCWRSSESTKHTDHSWRSGVAFICALQLLQLQAAVHAKMANPIMVRDCVAVAAPVRASIFDGPHDWSSTGATQILAEHGIPPFSVAQGSL